MEAVVVEREAKGMKEIAIQEKDLTLQWRGNTGKLVKVRLKNTRAMEMWYNKQITEENIQEITTLNIIKNGKSLALEVYPEKSIYVKPNLG
ncbi:pheromone response system RNA-binding regulator PrgU, partial [Enterococcus faecalis]